LDTPQTCIIPADAGPMLLFLNDNPENFNGAKFFEKINLMF
jgi:hypothetical protein